MEKITDSFRVATPLETTWRTLLDIERIAPCLPGAQLQEIEGDEYRGVVKVKVGPITAQYKGVARLAEVDETARTITIDASGRDTRNGNANATIVVRMRDDLGATQVDVATELTVTGKVAQFGRGILSDVSAKLLAQFVANLERDVLAAGGAPEAAAAGTQTATESPTGSGPGPRRVDHAEVEPVDLMETAGGAIARRAIPVVAAALFALVLLRRRRQRRRRHRD